MGLGGACMRCIRVVRLSSHGLAGRTGPGRHVFPCSRHALDASACRLLPPAPPPHHLRTRTPHPLLLRSACCGAARVRQAAARVSGAGAGARSAAGGRAGQGQAHPQAAHAPARACARTFTCSRPPPRACFRSAGTYQSATSTTTRSRWAGLVGLVAWRVCVRKPLVPCQQLSTCIASQLVPSCFHACTTLPPTPSTHPPPHRHTHTLPVTPRPAPSLPPHAFPRGRCRIRTGRPSSSTPPAPCLTCPSTCSGA